MLPNLLVAEDIKEYLHIGNAALYRLLAEKDFPSFRIKHKYYVIEEDFVSWMKTSAEKKVYTLE